MQFNSNRQKRKMVQGDASQYIKDKSLESKNELALVPGKGCSN